MHSTESEACLPTGENTYVLRSGEQSRYLTWLLTMCYLMSAHRET
jgi:hypothetical protein